MKQFFGDNQKLPKLKTKQLGFMSCSFSKKIALEFAFGLWSEGENKIPVLIEILCD